MTCLVPVIYYRLKDEVVSVKIYGRGEKFDLGGGRQFDNIEDLIMYYKKNPFNIVGGKQVHLHQVNIFVVIAVAEEVVDMSGG